MSSKQGLYSDVQHAARMKTDGQEDHHNDDSGAVLAMDVEGVAFQKGELQVPAYRDKWFGILFIAHLGAMVAVAAMYATGTLETVDGDRRRRFLEEYAYEQDEDLYEQDEDLSEQDEIRFLSTFLLSIFISPALSIVTMSFMATNGVKLIQYSLYFSIGLNAIAAIVLVVVEPMGAITPGIFALILVCYARSVWHRIPFAASNLRAAITCVQANLGMAMLALASIPLVTGWVVLWGYVMQSVMRSPWMLTQEYETEVTDDLYHKQHEEENMTTEGMMATMALMLSFYWTWHVMRNVVHTTLAGTVGTWWFLPNEASSCCSRGLTDSLCRSLTYSFGSICLGSLIVAIIEVIKSIVRSAARSRRGGISRCIAECLLVWIERIAEYFNKWAFIYVGLYGYSYVEAGKNVLSLFRHRGWSTIISDSLVTRMLAVMCFCIGLVNALVAVILTLGSDPSVIGLSALFALFVGMLMSSLVFGVLVSAVDSIIVLFAEAPREFKENHPALAQEMEDAWTQAWPDVFSGAITPTATPIV
jgi:hypothetical protein